MSTDNSILYTYVSDLLRIPPVRKYIEDAGGYIISTGLVWPIKTVEGETVYYYINVLGKEIRFLPDFSADLHTAEVVTNQDEILFALKHLQVYIQNANTIAKLSSAAKKVSQQGLFFGKFSLS